MGDFRVFSLTPWLELLTGMERKQRVAVFKDKIPAGLTEKKLYPTCFADVEREECLAKYLVCLGTVEDVRMFDLYDLADYKPKVHSAVKDVIIILAEKR